MSHEQNTFDKKKLLHSNNKFVKESPLRVKNFIQNPELMQFYHHDINELLKDYTPGDVKNKPKVLAEIKRRDEERKQMQDNRPSGIVVTKDGDSTPHELTIKEVKAYMSHKTQESLFLKNKVEELMKENERLKKVIESHTALKTEVS